VCLKVVDNKIYGTIEKGNHDLPIDLWDAHYFESNPQIGW